MLNPVFIRTNTIAGLCWILALQNDQEDLVRTEIRLQMEDDLLAVVDVIGLRNAIDVAPDLVAGFRRNNTRKKVK